ncbi:MAG: amidase [Pseudomonadales bacterium]|nr:amidase [Pseudomonadales bacterium]
MKDLHYASLSEVCARIKSGELTSVQVTTALLARIGDLDRSLHAYVRVLADRALEQAAALDARRDAGAPLGALHGVPIALKDLFHTRGIATASGTLVMADFVPDTDATVVTRLQQAGAVIIGKTQLTEGAFGVHHPEVEAPRNPWNPDYWPGVSSSGSGVAVAAGLAYGALGTDTGGSIRFPSACCGIVGIKPTYGRVSRHGAFPLAESLDHVGPMTRSVADAARMLQVLAGADPLDPTSLSDAVPNYSAALGDGIRGLTLGVDWDYVSEGVEGAVVDTVREAVLVFETLGVKVREVRLPAAYRRLVKEWGITCAVECARAHRQYYPASRSLYGPVLSGLIELGLQPPPGAYESLAELRVQFRTELDALLNEVEMLISPCMPMLPPTVAQMAGQSEAIVGGAADFITFTAPFDYSGHPTLTLPAGLAANGLPKSFQLIGRWLSEARMIQAGAAYERVVAFDRHPPL